MSQALKRIESTILLLVEGEDEQRFISALLKARNRADVQVHPVGGKYQVHRVFKTVRLTPGFERVQWIGIAQDADDDGHAAFQRICKVFEDNGLPVPSGAWHPSLGEPVTAALVWPDGIETGDLEVLVWRAIGDAPTAGCVEEFMRCVGSATALPRQVSKATIHAYLASLDPPDRRLGEAAAGGLLPLLSSVFDPILRLLPPGPGR